MLEQQLEWHITSSDSCNEIVLDASAYSKQLPDAVEAFFFTPRATQAQREKVAAARLSFLLMHSRSSAETPMLVYDSGRRQPENGSPEPFIAVRSDGYGFN